MSGEEAKRDLIVLVADRDMEEAVDKLLPRAECLGVASFSFRVIRHPNRDPGCRTGSEEVLRQYTTRFRYALVIFDREGSSSDEPREKIQGEVEASLGRTGWEDRARAIAIEPELEAWIWAGSLDVSRALGWGHGYDGLRSWLASQGLWPHDSPKPPDPKKAMIRAMERKRKRRSARVFGDVAEHAPLDLCRDPAFNDLTAALRKWFPVARR